MIWTSFHTNLRNVLAHYFRSQADSDALLIEAGLDLADVEANPRPITRWTLLITEVAIRKHLPALIAAALGRYPDDEYLLAARRGDLTGVSGPDVDWHGAQLEKVIGKDSTLLHVAFLERGMQVAKSVVRIAFPEGSGTGFVVQGVQGPFVITNNHVLPDVERVQAAKVQFNYQLTVDQLDATPIEKTFAVGCGFATSKEHDWSAVSLDNLPAGVTPLELKPQTLQKGDPVNIIQHPAGGLKQIGLYHNIIVYADENIVQYLTDTKPGSSGAPGFNNDWQVISLHHSGGWLSEPGSKQTAWRNEGIHVNAVIDGLLNASMM